MFIREICRNKILKLALFCSILVMVSVTFLAMAPVDTLFVDFLIPTSVNVHHSLGVSYILRVILVSVPLQHTLHLGLEWHRPMTLNIGIIYNISKIVVVLYMCIQVSYICIYVCVFLVLDWYHHYFVLIQNHSIPCLSLLCSTD